MATLTVTAQKLVSHRNGSTTLDAFRQGYNGESGGNAGSIRWTGHMFFDPDDFSPLSGKIIDKIVLRMTSTSWGNSGSYAFWIKKSPFTLGTSGSYLVPNDFYPAGDIDEISSYIATPEFARSETHDTELTEAYLNHVKSGKGLASYRGGVTSVPSSSVYTREVTANPKLIITYHDATSACGAPTSASLSASVSEGNVTLSFSGGTAGTNNAITGLEVQYAESDDGSTWGAWTAYNVFSISSGSGSVSVAPSSTRGKYRKFQARIQGAGGSSYYSGWKAVTGSVRKNSAPAAPGVTAPVASKTIYNAQPRILATVGSDADGHTQTLAASGYAASSTGAQAVGKKLVLRRSSAATAGAQSVSLSSTDAQNAASSATARSFTYAVPAWTDPSLVAGETPIRAVHMTELRAAIDNVRAYYGMAAYSWTTITAGVTGLAGWTSHVQELRTAIDQVVSLVNGWDTANSTNDISLPAWITISENRPAAAVIAQLRAAIPLL